MMNGKKLRRGEGKRPKFVCRTSDIFMGFSLETKGTVPGPLSKIVTVRREVVGLMVDVSPLSSRGF